MSRRLEVHDHEWQLGSCWGCIWTLLQRFIEKLHGVHVVAARGAHHSVCGIRWPALKGSAQRSASDHEGSVGLMQISDP